MKHPGAKSLGVRQACWALLSIVLMIVAISAIRGLSSNVGQQNDQFEISRLAYPDRAVPTLLKWLGVRALNEGLSVGFKRNPFQFAAKIVDRPLPPPPGEPPEATPTVDPAAKPTGDSSCPTTPAFNRDYLGFLGPHYLPVAAFRKDGEVHVATVGHVLDETFIVRRIGPGSVDIGLVGHPEAKLTTVLVTDD